MKRGRGVRNMAGRISSLQAWNLKRKTWNMKLWALQFLRITVLIFAAGRFFPGSAFAQVGSSGVWPIEIYGMVQVEPGSHVLTFAVKNEEIRFSVSDVRSSDRRISMARFLSDTRPHTPSVHIKGNDSLLELLIKERPSKRVLRLTGLYYVDTRVFVVNGIIPFREQSKPPL